MEKILKLPHRQQQVAKSLIRLPWILMVALTGSYAEGRATNKSDIDLFIQTTPGRLYLARLLVTLYVHLLGLRRTNTSIAGKLCLNWFGTTNLPRIRGRKHQIIALRSSEPTSMLRSIEVMNKAIDLLEGLVRDVQVARFKKDKRTYLKNSQVRWSDNELGFHPPKE